MRKYTKIGCILLVLLVGFAACKKDNLDPLGQWDFTVPALSAPVSDASLVLDNENTLTTLRFEWGKAETSQRFNIRYRVVLVHPDSTGITDPLFSANAADNGRALFANVTHQAIDAALSAAGYALGETVTLKWGVVAEAVGRSVFDLLPISITRLEREDIPDNLYIAGAATEAGADVSNAIRLKRLQLADGTATGIFEGYTALEAGEGFRFYAQRGEQGRVIGGSDGIARNNGDPITVAESGTYRVRIDLEENTYTLLKIEKWSLVGSAVQGGWGGDVPLEYQGGGIWSSSVNLLEPAGEDARFIFRANEDWGIVIKQVRNTANNVLMESDTEDFGFEVDDIEVNSFGAHIVTLNLSADGYTYSIEADESIEAPTYTPDNLYLIGGESPIALNKSENAFTTPGHVALQANRNYYFSVNEDGSGQRYSLAGLLGIAENLSGDNVSGNVDFGSGGTSFQVNQDQAYALTIDFSSARVSWKFYNIKLFHWGEWEDRLEIPMTYSHPFRFVATAALTGGYESKFNSPWDIQLGSSSTALTGDLADGGENITSITESGDYDVRIVLQPDLKSGAYSFVKK